MEFRRNIIFSAVLHATIIIAIFAVNVSVRDMTKPLRPDYLTVSLFKEMTGTTNSPVPAPSNKTRFLINAQNVKKKETASKNSSDKVDVTISANQHASISEETNMSHSAFKENESNPPEFTYTPLWKRDNPPKSPFIKGGLEGDFKMGMEGLPEQNSASQNIYKSQSGYEILESTKRRPGKGGTGNPYVIIRDAIEKAKTYPFLARKKRIEGTVITNFIINSNGYPQDIKIEKSSGSEILDSAAIKIVMKAAPFPVVDGQIAVPISFKLTNHPLSFFSSR